MDPHTAIAPLRPFMARVLEEIGPRPSCSPAERRLGARLEEDWAQFCDRVAAEPFTCHPRAFLGWLHWLPALYLAALFAWWLFPPLALPLAGAGVVVLWVQGVRFGTLLDPLFPTAEGVNVVGTVAPRGPVARRVYVVAHQDSAYEFSFWYRFKNLSLPLMLVGAAAFVWLALAGAVAWMAWPFGALDSGIFSALGWSAAALYPVVGLFAFFTLWTPVPGALDNLSGIAVQTALGQAAAAGPGGGRALEGTEVVLLACSSEEAGLRGSRAYVARHRVDLGGLPTFVLNLDGLGDARHLTLLARELWTGARYDDRLMALLEGTAREHGLGLRRATLPLGGTDAAPFANAGFPAVTLIAQDSGRLIPEYHTRLDVLEAVSDDALAAGFALGWGLLTRLDAGALDRSAPATTP
ncbi:MAG: M28 family peptidase [Pseudomonadota bacterium]